MNFGLHHFTYNYKLPDNRSPVLKDARVQSLVNRAVFAMGIMTTVVTIPQVLKVWTDRNHEGVSVISWIGFTFSSLFWLMYGLIHKDKAIIISSFGALIMDLLVVGGIFFYR